MVVIGVRPDFRLQVADIGRSITVLALATATTSAVAAASLLHLVLMVGNEIGRWQFPFAASHEDAHKDDDQDDNDDGQADADDDD